MLDQDQVQSYHDNGYLHIPEVFSEQETDRLETELDRLVSDWAVTDKGWSGPWREKYMDEATEKESKLTAMHDLYFYSEAWSKAVSNHRLTNAMSQLIGPDVELHHSTMHIKPPETGHPFPMHQDWAFYQHQDGRYVDVLVHLDDTSHENGEIRFLSGSHKSGALEHVTQTSDGPCTPHLPTDEYNLSDTVAVPAKRGDVVCFCIHTIHGSHINQTERARRLVRIGYRAPDNSQIAGQSMGRPGLMVSGYRNPQKGQGVFSNAGPA